MPGWSCLLLSQLCLFQLLQLTTSPHQFCTYNQNTHAEVAWCSMVTFCKGIIKDGIVMVKIVGDLQNTHNINHERWICPLFSAVSYFVGRQTVNYFCPSSHVLFSEKHITQHRTGNILELVSWHKNTNTLGLTYGSEKFQKTHLGFAEFSIWWRNHS